MPSAMRKAGFQLAVVPAKAGIHFASISADKINMDPRFRGDDAVGQAFCRGTGSRLRSTSLYGRDDFIPIELDPGSRVHPCTAGMTPSWRHLISARSLRASSFCESLPSDMTS